MVTFMKTDTNEIANKLAMNGWALESVCVNAGGYRQQADWSVTIKRNNQSYRTEYHNGSRRWKKSSLAFLPSFHTGTYAWADHFRRGQPVNVCSLPRLKDPAECKLEQRERQQLAFNEFARLTEPDAPTLDTVVHCLYMDASSVRHGQTFEDWCCDCGADTDSIKALKCYNACRDTWSALVRLGADFDFLEELFQDY